MRTRDVGPGKSITCLPAGQTPSAPLSAAVPSSWQRSRSDIEPFDVGGIWGTWVPHRPCGGYLLLPQSVAARRVRRPGCGLRPLAANALAKRVQGLPPSAAVQRGVPLSKGRRASAALCAYLNSSVLLGKKNGPWEKSLKYSLVDIACVGNPIENALALRAFLTIKGGGRVTVPDAVVTVQEGACDRYGRAGATETEGVLAGRPMVYLSPTRLTVQPMLRSSSTASRTR